MDESQNQENPETSGSVRKKFEIVPDTPEEAKDMLIFAQSSVDFTTLINDYLNKKYPIRSRIGKQYTDHAEEEDRLLTELQKTNDKIRDLKRIDPDFYMLREEIDAFRVRICSDLLRIEKGRVDDRSSTSF